MKKASRTPNSTAPLTTATRMERDTMGELPVPSNAYYGVQTARAIENFPISSLRIPRAMIRAMGLIKRAAASVNHSLKLLDKKPAAAIVRAATEVVDGRLDAEFPVDIFQTGSGTSTNMNTNEVISNRATELLGGARGSKLVHPNDHVNLGQSSNDVVPTAIHIAASETIQRQLIPALTQLHKALNGKAREFDKIVKIGRTHLQDATPVRLGQEFGGYARQIELGIARMKRAQAALSEVALGGTAVGTGLNAHVEFADRAAAKIAGITGLPFVSAPNKFAALAAHDALVFASGAIKTLRQHIESLAAAGPLELSEGDGMIDYSRRHFNRLGSLKEQDAYIAGLKAKRYYWINDWKIPKLVHDALAQSVIESFDHQRLNPFARETSR